MFQSPPPKRGACDTSPMMGSIVRILPAVSIPSAEAGGVRPVRLQRRGEKLVGCGFNPLRRSGGRATSFLKSYVTKKVAAGFNPLRRSGGRATAAAEVRRSKLADLCRVSIPSAEAGGVRRWVGHIDESDDYIEGLVSIPSAEAGGVRRPHS